MYRIFLSVLSVVYAAGYQTTRDIKCQSFLSPYDELFELWQTIFFRSYIFIDAHPLNALRLDTVGS
jgi:hypothetical protein